MSYIFPASFVFCNYDVETFLQRFDVLKNVHVWNSLKWKFLDQISITIGNLQTNKFLITYKHNSLQ
jgi:hypothetical protein